MHAASEISEAERSRLPTRLDQNSWQLRLRDNWVRERKRQIDDPNLSNYDSHRSRFFSISEDLREELATNHFELIKEFFEALQHAYIYGNLIPLTRIFGDQEYVNYMLRIANSIMTGRRFDRENGKICILRTANERLSWKEEKIVAVYLAMLGDFDPDCDELPILHPKVIELITKYVANDE